MTGRSAIALAAFALGLSLPGLSWLSVPFGIFAIALALTLLLEKR